jgi:hypothetical protein
MNGLERLEGRMGRMAAMVEMWIQAEGEDIIELEVDELIDQFEDEI